MDFNHALAHIMISKGSVAKPRFHKDIHGGHEWNYDRFGSHYGSSIEGQADITLEFYLRLASGAKVIYDKCGPSDFGQESRFDGTDADNINIKYALFPVVLDDDPDNPIDLVAQVDTDAFQNSFVQTLEMLSTWDKLSFEDCVDQLRKRCEHTDKYGNNFKLLWPNLFSKDM